MPGLAQRDLRPVFLFYRRQWQPYMEADSGKNGNGADPFVVSAYADRNLCAVAGTAQLDSACQHTECPLFSVPVCGVADSADYSHGSCGDLDFPADSAPGGDPDGMQLSGVFCMGILYDACWDPEEISQILIFVSASFYGAEYSHQ